MKEQYKIDKEIKEQIIKQFERIFRCGKGFATLIFNTYEDMCYKELQKYIKPEVKQTAFYIHYKKGKHIKYKDGSKIYCILVPLDNKKALNKERIFIHYN